MDLALMNTADSSEEGAWLEILDFDWETPIGCSLLVLGPDSREALKINDEEEKFNQKRLAESFAGSKKSKDSADNEVGADKAIRKALALTKGWKDVEWDGKPFPFNTENALILFTKIPHIRVQVLNFYRDRANFMKPEYANWRKRFGEGSSSTSPGKAEAASGQPSKP